MDIISTKKTNTKAVNVTNTGSINCHREKVIHKIYCYILDTVSLAIILLLVIICYHYIKHSVKVLTVNIQINTLTQCLLVFNKKELFCSY